MFPHCCPSQSWHRSGREPHGYPAETTGLVSPHLPMRDCSLTLTLNSQHPMPLWLAKLVLLVFMLSAGHGLACPSLGGNLVQKAYCPLLGSSLSCSCVYMVGLCIWIVPSCEQLKGRVYYSRLCISRAWNVS